jgi:ketosteroid isomerase-like protein
LPGQESPIDVLKSGYAAFNRRDADALRALMADDFHWNEAEGVPGRKVCRSAEEFLAYMSGFDRLWDEFTFEPISFDATSTVTVTVTVSGRGIGRAGGEPAEIVIHHVWRLDGSRVSRMDAFLDPRDAADAAASPPGHGADR